MTIAQARLYMRQFARDASDESSYDLDEIDRAIQAVADDFIHATRCTRTVANIAITEAAAALGSFPSGFLPEMILRAWITGKGDLDIIDHSELVKLQVQTTNEDGDELTATPRYLAFSSLTTGEVHPTPDDDYTLKIQYVAPFTSFTPGQSTSSTVLNIPDHYLRNILVYGATALLQHNEEEKRYASTSWRKYENFRDSCIGAGNLGTQLQSSEGADL